MARVSSSERGAILAIMAVGLLLLAPRVDAQGVRYGSPVSPAVKDLYARGLTYLADKQSSNGSWGDAGVTAICLMAMIASGEDPNFGRYAESVRKSIRFIIDQQDATTGFIRSGMYQHGFAMLALADVYGAVDEELLWKDGSEERRTVGQALELAVRCAITSQEQNPFGAWRYSPRAKDADTSVSGAVLMGLLAARNAGIEVPDAVIDKAIDYFVSMTAESGTVAYAGLGGFGDSLNRSAIATLVYAIAKRKDLDAYQATIDYLRDNVLSESRSHPYYFRYYMAQALFQGDYDAWKKWTKENTNRLVELQNGDGSLGAGQYFGGHAYSTGMLLLSAALDYCFLPIYER